MFDLGPIVQCIVSLTRLFNRNYFVKSDVSGRLKLPDPIVDMPVSQPSTDLQPTKLHVTVVWDLAMSSVRNNVL